MDVFALDSVISGAGQPQKTDLIVIRQGDDVAVRIGQGRLAVQLYFYTPRQHFPGQIPDVSAAKEDATGKAGAEHGLAILQLKSGVVEFGGAGAFVNDDHVACAGFGLRLRHRTETILEGAGAARVDPVVDVEERHIDVAAALKGKRPPVGQLFVDDHKFLTLDRTDQPLANIRPTVIGARCGVETKLGVDQSVEAAEFFS